MRPPITRLDDVRPDPSAEMADAADEHLQTVGHVARCMAAEYASLVEQGTSPVAAAIMTGQRWRMTS